MNIWSHPAASTEYAHNNTLILQMNDSLYEANQISHKFKLFSTTHVSLDHLRHLLQFIFALSYLLRTLSLLKWLALPSKQSLTPFIHHLFGLPLSVRLVSLYIRFIYYFSFY